MAIQTTTICPCEADQCRHWGEERTVRSDILLSTVAIAALLAITGCSHGSQHLHAGEETARQAAHTDDPQPATVDIQGANEWKRSPHMRAYYDFTVATFANGTSIDVDAYEARSFDIFREFARANGASEEGMVDHLKLIPRQIVDIVKEDPAVLQSYDTFWAALAGPD
jgi:hypothetical protein